MFSFFSSIIMINIHILMQHATNAWCILLAGYQLLEWMMVYHGLVTVSVLGWANSRWHCFGVGIGASFRTFLFWIVLQFVSLVGVLDRYHGFWLAYNLLPRNIQILLSYFIYWILFCYLNVAEWCFWIMFFLSTIWIVTCIISAWIWLAHHSMVYRQWIDLQV